MPILDYLQRDLRLRRSHPLVRGLVFAWRATPNFLVEDVKGRTGTNHSFDRRDLAAVKSGRALLGASGKYITWPNVESDVLFPNDFTALVLAKQNQSGTYWLASKGNDSAANAHSFMIGRVVGTGAVTRLIVGCSTNEVIVDVANTTTALDMIGVSKQGTAAKMYMNGVLKGSGTLATAITGTNGDPLSLSGRADGTQSSASLLAGVWLWNRCLSQQEIASFSIRPSRIYRPRRRIWFRAQVATGAMDGSSAPVITGAATGAKLFAGAGSSAPVMTGAATGAELAAGDGSSAPAITGAATGATVFAGAGSSAPTITAGATGAELATGAGSSAPSITADATGAKLAAGAGSSAPTVTADATSSALAAVAGSSAPTVSGAATGAELAAAAGSSSPTVAADATGMAAATGAGSSAPTVTAGATGAELATGAGSSAPTVTGAATGAELAAGAGSSAPAITAGAVGAELAAGAGSSAPTVTGAATGSELATGAGSSSPTITADATGQTVAAGQGAGSSAPVITGAATSSALVAGAGSSSPTITGAATSSSGSTAAGAGSSAPTITANATSTFQLAMAGSSAPTVTANATSTFVMASSASSAPVITGAATMTALFAGAGSSAPTFSSNATIQAAGEGTVTISTGGEGSGAITDRVPPVSIRAELPEASSIVRPLHPNEVGNTLAVRLVPVVDRIRQLQTRFGLRPYRVFLVHVLWGGGRVGSGSPIELSRREILPTPLVTDMGATSEVLRATGLTEEGGITIKEISAKYAEDDLMGRTMDLQDPALPRTSSVNVEFFWEVVENRVPSPQPVRRRYHPSSAPSLSRDGFQWSIGLVKQANDRSRDGTEIPRSRF